MYGHTTSFHVVCGPDESVRCGPDLGLRNFAIWDKTTIKLFQTDLGLNKELCLKEL